MIGTVLAALPDYKSLDVTRFNGKTVSDFFNMGLVNIIFFAAGVAFIIYFISAGLSMMTSRGDPKALAAAKARVTTALIGFIIVFAAYWIVQVVGLLLGLNGFGGIFA